MSNEVTIDMIVLIVKDLQNLEDVGIVTYDAHLQQEVKVLSFDINAIINREISKVLHLLESYSGVHYRNLQLNCMHIGRNYSHMHV